VRIYGLVRVFGNAIGPATGQVPKLLICSWSVTFPFRGSQVDVYFPLVGCVLMWLCLIAGYDSSCKYSSLHVSTFVI
jgi:hypothetical protein